MVKHAKAQEKGAGSSLRRRQTLLAWGFALPFAVIFCVFMLIPLISSMAMSFHRHHIPRPAYPVQRELRRTRPVHRPVQ